MPLELIVTALIGVYLVIVALGHVLVIAQSTNACARTISAAAVAGRPLAQRLKPAQSAPPAR